MIDEKRAAFEAWAEGKAELHKMPSGEYSARPTRLARDAWQAALASPEVQALRHDLEQYVGIASELATENEKMRVALEMIAGMRPCPDSLMGNADIARAALAAMEK